MIPSHVSCTIKLAVDFPLTPEYCRSIKRLPVAKSQSVIASLSFADIFPHITVFLQAMQGLTISRSLL